MSGAIHVSVNIKKEYKYSNIYSWLSCTSAYQLKLLKKEKSIDFVFTNEGVYALRNALKLVIILLKIYQKLKVLLIEHKDEIIMNEPEKIVPNDKMDTDLPGYAWDLLPYKSNL